LAIEKLPFLLLAAGGRPGETVTLCIPKDKLVPLISNAVMSLTMSNVLTGGWGRDFALT
jgi:hypothetical protein